MNRSLAFLPLFCLLGCLPRLEVVHAGGNGPATFMLLHGYGSDAAHWLPYALGLGRPAVPLDAG